MIVEKKKLNDSKIESLGEVRSMKFDAGSEAEIFDILTDGLYSDPIGSIVREVTSNCFDAHVEAGNDNASNPVVVRLTKEVSGNFISFIDNGVGMSPDRVYNIYGTYLKSTKNETNDQIGGFGLGGKTPLTYNAKSFFAITRKDGVKYTYNIFEGDDSPKIELMSQESTKKGNGTEIKVPVLESDIREFEQKTLRQLFYFENIVFEGFSDDYVTNDYTIIRGENFLFRGYEYDNYMHVCLGKVAYPIAYETLGIEQSEYRIPVAIKLEIGELDGTGVTRSREQLKYTTKNREIIIKKLDAAKEELKNLLSKQMDNVQGIEDYYHAMNNYSVLKLTDEVKIDVGSIIEKTDVVLPNFKYSDIKMPSENELIDVFYSIKRYGKKETRRSYSFNNRTFKGIKYRINNERKDIVHTTGEFKRVVLKQSYLQHQYNRFYLYTPYNFSDKENLDRLVRELGLAKYEQYTPKKAKVKFNANGVMVSDGTKTRLKYLVPKKKAEKLVKEFMKEVKDLMVKYAVDYDELVVPDSYKEFRKKKTITTDLLKDDIKVKLLNGWSGNRSVLKFKDLVDFKGTIYYGFRDDESALRDASNIVGDISGDNALSTTYRSVYNGKADGFRGVLFAQVAKGSEKHFKLLGRKAIHVKYFYHTYLSRKIDIIIGNLEKANIRTMYNENVHHFFKESDFDLINEEIANDVELIEKSMDIKTDIRTHNIREWEFERVFGFKLSEVKGKFKHQDVLDRLVELTRKNEHKLKYLSYPNDLDVTNEAHKHFIELTNLSIEE